MAKTIIRVRQGAIAYYLNEVSAGASNSGKRYRLSQTSVHGGDKDGWVRVNSTECKTLMEIATEADLFKACADVFANKKLRPHIPHGGIRGLAGKWEGVAFPLRVTHGRAATQNADNEIVSRHGAQ